MIAFAKELHRWVCANLGKMLAFDVTEEGLIEIEGHIAAQEAPHPNCTDVAEKNAAVASHEMILAIEHWATEQKLRHSGLSGGESDPSIVRSLKSLSDQLEAALAPPTGSVIATVWDFPNYTEEQIARQLGWKLPTSDPSMRPEADVARVRADIERSRENRNLATKVEMNRRYRVDLASRYVATCEAWAKRKPQIIGARKLREPKTEDELDAIIREAYESGGNARWIAERWSKGQFSEEQVMERAAWLGVRLADMPVSVVRKGQVPTDQDTARAAEERMMELLALPFDGDDPGATVRSLKNEHNLTAVEIEKTFRLNRQPISLTEIVGYLKPEPAAPTKPAKQKASA